MQQYRELVEAEKVIEIRESSDYVAAWKQKFSPSRRARDPKELVREAEKQGPESARRLYNDLPVKLGQFREKFAQLFVTLNQNWKKRIANRAILSRWRFARLQIVEGKSEKVALFRKMCWTWFYWRGEKNSSWRRKILGCFLFSSTMLFVIPSFLPENNWNKQSAPRLMTMWKTWEL